MKQLTLLLFLAVIPAVYAQVEIYRPQQADTATYIAPGDTITCAPKFENGDQDFFRYIETRFNLRNNSTVLDYSGENIRFSFYVEKDGSVTDYTHLYGSNAIVASEIERIVTTMPAWKPGYLSGKKKKTLMVYDILIKRVDDFPPVQIVANDRKLEYTDKTKQIKWFIVGGTLLILVSLWISSFIK